MDRTMGTSYDHHAHYHVCSMRCLSWSAIIFGGLVAIALAFLFNIFSLSIGLTAFPVSPEGKTQFAAWGFVGLVVIGIVTMFIAGWVAGFLGRSYCYKRRMGELYGFGAWALALVVTIFLASQMTQFLNQRSYAVDRALSPMQLSIDMTRNVNEAAAMAKRPTSGETEEAADRLGIAGFATFFILFMGALSATFGGRIGMHYKRSETIDNCPVCK